jgi:preprotein translocase subunit SecE
VAEKPVKVKQPEKEKADARAQETVKAKQPEKTKAVQTKAPDKDKEKPRQPNRVVRWYHETVGELRKVTWPTPQAAWRLTYIVIIVMLSTALVLGALDFIFSRLVGLLVQI